MSSAHHGQHVSQLVCTPLFSRVPSPLTCGRKPMPAANQGQGSTHESSGHNSGLVRVSRSRRSVCTSSRFESAVLSLLTFGLQRNPGSAQDSGFQSGSLSVRTSLPISQVQSSLTRLAIRYLKQTSITRSTNRALRYVASEIPLTDHIVIAVTLFLAQCAQPPTPGCSRRQPDL